MVEVPYLIVVIRRTPEFECPHCGTGLAAEWDRCQPDASNNIVEECPACQRDINYGTKQDGTGFLVP